MNICSFFFFFNFWLERHNLHEWTVLGNWFWNCVLTSNKIRVQQWSMCWWSQNPVIFTKKTLCAITSLINLKTEKLMKKDIVIVCGGKRDVAKNEANIWLRHFAKHRMNTNVIALCAPHCFYLQSFSCVNKEANTFSWKLQNVTKLSRHIQTYSMSNNRAHLYYTLFSYE